LYQLAFNLYENTDKGINTEGFLFSLLLINNQAALVYQEANTNHDDVLAATQCFQYNMLSRIKLLTQKGDHERLAFCNGLIRNTTHLISL
jgi:hypothetical protein